MHRILKYMVVVLLGLTHIRTNCFRLSRAHPGWLQKLHRWHTSG